ncbi:unnamed protein product [Penicillium bialowiezense]
MPVGGCFCGKVRVNLNGPPMTSGLCYCDDCRKLTGAPFTYNFIANFSNITITGTPKEVAKSADSGNEIKNYFCPDCGTPLYGRKINEDGEPDETTIIRAGIFDDGRIVMERKPDAEIFTERRPQWINPIEGAAQFKGML